MKIQVLMCRETGVLGLGFRVLPLKLESGDMNIDKVLSDETHEVVLINRSAPFWVVQSYADQPFVFIGDQNIVHENLEIIGEL